MTSYLLRDIDDSLWTKARERAKRDGRSMRGLILWLLMRYVAGKVR